MKPTDILFKAKLSHSNEWIEGNLIIANNERPYIMPSSIIEPDGHHLRIDSDSPFWVDPSTLCMWTTLNDKNGKKVFSGDVVRCKEWDNMSSEFLEHLDDREMFDIDELKGELKEDYTSEVIFDEANFYVNQGNNCEVPLCCFFGNAKYCNPIFEIEIISSIHDNPELIEEKK